MLDKLSGTETNGHGLHIYDPEAFLIGRKAVVDDGQPLPTEVASFKTLGVGGECQFEDLVTKIGEKCGLGGCTA